MKYKNICYVYSIYTFLYALAKLTIYVFIVKDLCSVYQRSWNCGIFHWKPKHKQQNKIENFKRENHSGDNLYLSPSCEIC